MLSPEIIERMKIEREERQRPALHLPLYAPEIIEEERIAEEEPHENSRVIIIDLL